MPGGIRPGYTQGNHFEILLNQTEIRLYLPFFEWFGAKRTFVWFQFNLEMVNTIWFRFDLIRFRTDFSVYIYCYKLPVGIEYRGWNQNRINSASEWQRPLGELRVFLCVCLYMFVCLYIHFLYVYLTDNIWTNGVLWRFSARG